MKLLTKQFCFSGSLESWIKTQNIHVHEHLPYWDNRGSWLIKVLVQCSCGNWPGNKSFKYSIKHISCFQNRLISHYIQSLSYKHQLSSESLSLRAAGFSLGRQQTQYRQPWVNTDTFLVPILKRFDSITFHEYQWATMLEYFSTYCTITHPLTVLANGTPALISVPSPPWETW